MISIAQRYRPFSHLPASRCLIPGTAYIVEAFPAFIRIFELVGHLVKEFEIDVQGPIKGFTVIQDLERGCVTLLSESYTLHVLQDLQIVFKKKPPPCSLRTKERLSFGVHKKQDWDEIRKRRDFKEIFPLWFHLGSQLSLPARSGDQKGMFTLLQDCHSVCQNHRPELILDAFEQLFLCGFHHFMIPRAIDEDHHGILKNPTETSHDSPLYLLSEGAALIRSLFFVQSEAHFSILPNLPPELFAGRMLNLAAHPFGEIQLEWSKKTIRRIAMRAQISASIVFQLPPAIKRFRLRKNREAKGRWYENGEPLAINSSSYYLLDQFQK